MRHRPHTTSQRGLGHLHADLSQANNTQVGRPIPPKSLVFPNFVGVFELLNAADKIEVHKHIRETHSQPLLINAQMITKDSQNSEPQHTALQTS